MSSQVVQLKFFVDYFGVGLSANSGDEINPTLSCWSSTIRNYELGVTKFPLFHYNHFSKKTTSKQEVGVPVHINSRDKCRRDASIWFEVIVSVMNVEGVYVGNRAGSGRIYLYELWTF